MFLVKMSQITGERELIGNVSKSTSFTLSQTCLLKSIEHKCSICFCCWLIFCRVLGDFIWLLREALCILKNVYLLQNTNETPVLLVQKNPAELFKIGFVNVYDTET